MKEKKENEMEGEEKKNSREQIAIHHATLRDLSTGPAPGGS